MVTRKDGVREDYVPKASYIDPEYVRLEAERLWPRVWQVACREEELPRPGDFVTYDILDDSITVVRGDDGMLRAFHNVCPHRGRRLTSGCGRAAQLVCRYHGWRWNLTGKNSHVVDREDWGGCLSDEDTHLQEVKLATWGGFVFINMDPAADPLEEFLAPVIEHCEKYEFEKLRYRWYRTVIYPANWKTMLEGFNEAYHVQQTHKQFLEYLEDYSNSAAVGRHSYFWYPPPPDGRPRFSPSGRLGRNESPDVLGSVLAYYDEIHNELGAMVTPRSYDAAQRLRDLEFEEPSSPSILEKLREFQVEAANRDGSGWPEGVTPEYAARSGIDWHVFPNIVYLHSAIDGVLCYRARPNGADPNSCIFDVWSLVRYPPDGAPPLEREFYDDYRKCDWGRVLNQDFANLSEVQRGMRSRAFKAARPNPVQERAVSNLHQQLEDFMFGSGASSEPDESAK